MKPSALTIRPITSDDWPAVDRIQRTAFFAEAIEAIATLQRLGELSPNTCFLATDQDPIGYLIAHPWGADDLPPLNIMLPGIPASATTFFIHDLALVPAARGCGVAPALVSEGFAAARALGMRDASLLSIQGSQGFWRRMGFIERPDLADKVRPVLNEFLNTEFVFMSRLDLD